MQRFFIASRLAIGTALAIAAVPAMAAGSYTSVSIGSLSQAYGDVPDSRSDAMGADVELSSSGGETLAYGTGTGKYVAKPETDSVYAASSLANGTLKAAAAVAWGANLPYNDSVYQSTSPFGYSAQQAHATADFGDSFRAYSGSTPYLWNDGSTATFHFAIDGNLDIPDVLHSPPGTTEAASTTRVYSIFSISVYAAGTLDLINQQQALYANYPQDPADVDAWWAQVSTLNDQINANEMTRDYWYLGDVVGSFGDVPVSDDAIGHSVDMSSGTGQIDFSFNPNGDFDWVMSLGTFVALDQGWENLGVSLDFSHTLTASYAGPEGSTTYSASGLFPSTLALGAAPGGVPEPATWAMMIMGFGLVGGMMRRPRIAFASA